MLTISDDILNNAGISAHELVQEIAIYLYAKNKLSFGQARKLSGLNILQFQELLYTNNIPNHYGITELEEDFESIPEFQKEMIVVSDTSAISNLFMIGELDILRKVYDEIFLPKAVMDELLILENFGLNIDSIKQANWIRSVEVTERNIVNQLLSDLDLGEAEAIVLAKNMHADWLLIDEAKGRKIAKNSGLQTIGLLGVLLFAKKEGIINEVKHYVELLITKAKFRMTEELFDRILILAHETK